MTNLTNISSKYRDAVMKQTRYASVSFLFIDETVFRKKISYGCIRIQNRETHSGILMRKDLNSFICGNDLYHFYHPPISVDISAFCSTSSASSARVIVGPTRPPQQTNSSDSRQSSSSTSFEKSNQSKSQLKASSQGE